MTEYIFVRHAECQKNLIGVTGGEGTRLTEKGVGQATLLADELSDKLYQPKIVACPAIQVIETAEILAARLQRPFIIDERLVAAGMGIVNGLTSEEMKRLYPEYASQLEKWRNLEIEAHELQIPGIEPPKAFWSRTVSSLIAHKEGDQIVVVATRSIMVLAANLSMKRSPEAGGGYKHVDIDHCQTVTVRL